MQFGHEKADMFAIYVDKVLFRNKESGFCSCLLFSGKNDVVFLCSRSVSVLEGHSAEMVLKNDDVLFLHDMVYFW